MSNGMQVRQSENFSLQCLSAQRQIYSMLKKHRFFQFMFCVFAPVALSFMARFLPNNEKFMTFVIAYSLIIIIVDQIIDIRANNKRSVAAKIQERFDRQVYTLKWNKNLLGDENSLVPDINEYSKKYLEKHKSYDALRDWYPMKYDTLRMEDAIFECQKVNISWDAGIRKSFCCFVFLITVTIIISPVAFPICFDLPPFSIATQVIPLIPLISHLVKTTFTLIGDIKMLDKIETSFQHVANTSSGVRLTDVETLQKQIFEHRKNCFLIPDFFYKLSKKNKQEKVLEEALIIAQNERIGCK